MAEYTPMMKQYFQIKNKYSDKDTILFYRLGDFYEMFFDDAIVASKELEIALTGRDCGQEERAPMCGVPFHSADTYIAKLIEKGYKVAICEQTEDPSQAKGIVRRDVIRVITPGTVLDETLLEDDKNNYLCSVYMDENGVGLSFIDVSTGETDCCEFSDVHYKTAAINEIAKYNPSEIIMNDFAMGDKLLSEQLIKRNREKFSAYHSWCFELDKAISRIYIQFNISDFSSIPLSKTNEFAVKSLGAALYFLYDTQKIALSHINKINFYGHGNYMEIDSASRRNLELCESMRDKRKKGTLLWVLDRTKTPMGARLMRKWVETPLLNCLLIQKRQNAIKELFDNSILRSDIIDSLKNIRDIERLLGKIVYKNANARDLVALKASLWPLPMLKSHLSKTESAALSTISKTFDDLSDIERLIDLSINDEPPITIKEGGIIKDSYNSKVDEYRKAIKNGKSWIFEIEAEEKERTGIKNLKIKFNKVFGYYIEVTNSQKENVPEDYIRKQTLANCERFITPRLKEVEELILTAQNKIVSLEYSIFCEIRDEIASSLERIKLAAEQIAQTDVYCSLAEVAKTENYTCPQVDLSDKLIIKDGRHPVVEKTLTESLFVPNDTNLDCADNKIAVITGPNMAGKSTYMRQIALITHMAQMGSFVPCKFAHIGVCDKIFTRVGAADDLASGQSTFMVEMNEVANILKNATSKSLLILDEIGRGTSTYDGLSIAWAVIEYIATNKNIGARTLFATHYHELTELEDKTFGIKNYCCAVKKRGDDITFLRKIISGGADGSFGIQVALLAGVPKKVTDRAKEIQKSLEEANDGRENSAPKAVPKEELLPITANAKEAVIAEFLKLDITTLTPIEALNRLYTLQNELKD